MLAALRSGITTVFIPKDNEKDLADIPDNVKKGLKIIPVAHVDDVIARALSRKRSRSSGRSRPIPSPPWRLRWRPCRTEHPTRPGNRLAGVGHVDGPKPPPIVSPQYTRSSRRGLVNGGCLWARSIGWTLSQP